MTQDHFVAIALSGELDLNRLAAAMGLGQRYRWEEPMLLNPEDGALLTVKSSGISQCHLYYFGSLIFINCSDALILSFCDRMARFAEVFRSVHVTKYRDTYTLKTGNGSELKITNENAVMPRYFPACVNIISFVIAKSVALERIEEQVDEELDHLYGRMANLFELSQRYHEIKTKSETLMDITEVFTGLSHAQRSTRLEWIIIILIALEIVLYVIDFLAK